MKRFIVLTIISGLRALSLGFALMLLFGALHGEVSSQVPPIGYWPSVWLAYLALWIAGNLAGGAVHDVASALDLEDSLDGR